MDLSKEDFERLFEVFKIECDEHIQNLNSALISLEENPNQFELIEEIFREAHSLKGAARMIKFTSIEKISHHLETVLGKIKNNELSFSSEINGLILKSLDTVEEIVQTISDGGAEDGVDISNLLNALQVSAKEDGPVDIEILEQDKRQTPKSRKQRKSALTSKDFESLFEVFKVECDEHIQNLNAALISLEEDSNQSHHFEEIFREAHSLKGAARMMNFKSIEDISHHIETILGKIKNKKLTFSTEIGDLILKGLDTVETIVKTIPKGEAEGDVDSIALINELEKVSSDNAPVKEGPIANTDRDIVVTEIEETEIKGDLDLFTQETRDSHKKLVDNLLKIEKQPENIKAIKNAHEQAYALKGSARIVKHGEMGDISLSMEKLLQEILNKTIPISSAIVSILLDGSDFIKSFIHQVEANEQSKTHPDFYKTKAAIDSLIKTPTIPQKEKDILSTDQAACSNVNPKKTERSVAPPPYEKSGFKTQTKGNSTNKQKSTVRVSSGKLDRLMDQAGELLIMKLKARQRLEDVQAIINDYNAFHRDIKNKPNWIRNEKDDNNTFNNDNNTFSKKPLLSEMGGRLSSIFDQLELLHKSLYDDFRQFSIIIEKLQDDVKKTRLFPFQTVLDVFPRMVRDLSVSVKKKVKLEVSGGDIELDKYILEEIKDPLMHIIRNCIDHGIESPEERVKLGKPETGLIKVGISHKGNNGVIKVRDDGKGINIERIKYLAIQKSIYSEKEINQMKEKQILTLIFHPGFSTSEIITDISGRGVGMDVVKANIEKINGTIEIETEASKGSTFTMTIPLTLSTTQSLKISVCGETYFLPVNMVEKIIKVVEKDLPVLEGYPAVYYADSYIPYVRLGSILEIPDAESVNDAELEKPVAVLKSGNTLTAFSMDRFVGEEEILMKGLGQHMKRVRNISGVTIMRDGNIAPVLNVTDLISTVQLSGFARSRRKIEKTVAKNELSVLVVDDSMMTRTLEKNILESHGYRVSTAVDGQDALSKLQEQNFDIIVSDVQMPNLNGLDFTGQVKQDKRFKHIPVILVTALESAEDKKRGIEVGADAYILKSSFDQSNLISTIIRLV